MSKTHWKKMFDYNYLGSHDLEPGKDLILTIKEVKKDMVQVPKSNKKEEKPVVYFQEKDVKPMILNVTNSRKIDEVANSPHIEDWKGVKVAIYIDSNIRFGSERVEGLRVKAAPRSDAASVKKAAGLRAAELINGIGGDEQEQVRKVFVANWKNEQWAAPVIEKYKAGELTAVFISNYATSNIDA